MTIKISKEREEIIAGILERIEFIVNNERTDEELQHLEEILRKTLDRFAEKDMWDEVYAKLRTIL